MTWHSRLAIIVKKLLNIFAALPNCQSTGGVSIEMAKPICIMRSNENLGWVGGGKSKLFGTV
jgi:hypothetical protein